MLHAKRPYSIFGENGLILETTTEISESDCIPCLSQIPSESDCIPCLHSMSELYSNFPTGFVKNQNEEQHQMTGMVFIERLSIDCRKTEVITLVYHKLNTQSTKPIKTQMQVHVVDEKRGKSVDESRLFLLLIGRQSGARFIKPVS